jgi:hypothetical protein
MKSFTIHNIDEKLAKKIEAIAKREGKSINQTVKTLLSEKLGYDPNDDRKRREEFLDLFGVWSEEDEIEFNENIEDFRKIDDQDWQ